MIPDISNLMALEKVKAANAKIPAKADHPMTWDSYHSLEDINAYLDYLEKTYPDLVTIETIGESYEKRTMRVVKICKNGCGKTLQSSKIKRENLIMCFKHSRRQDSIVD